MNSLFIRIIRQWIPLSVAISGITFIVYLVIQQDLRIGANDPQIQMSQDLAASLNDGQAASTPGKIDIEKSLAPFTIIYDKHGNVISSNAFLNGKTPTIPNGALSPDNRITWQPQEGVRVATVINSYNNGYVLIGRNLKEIEIRESQQFNNILLGWIITLVATFSCVYIMQAFMRRKK